MKLKRKRGVYIQEVLKGGFVVKIGRQMAIVCENKESLIIELGRYLDNRSAITKEYTETK